MRIKLEQGKQKELILAAKNDLTWKDLAKLLNISPLYLSTELKNEKRSISEDTYNQLKKLANINFDQYIVQKLSDNWGKVMGGKNSFGSNIKKINYPEESENFAELIGIILGDGNLTKIKKKKVGVYQLRIVGDSRNDANYLLNFVKPLIETLFSIQVNATKIKTCNGLNLTSTGLRLIEYLEKKGLKSGDKIKNQITIPGWIKEKDIFLKACLRGLFDTDGSFYKLTKQSSHQISFRNYNATLIQDVKNSLRLLGINCSEISKGNEITITKKIELLKFLKEIGFHNSKHSNKVENWKNSLVV